MKAGEILFREGNERRRVFVVESGWLKLTRTQSDGQRQIVGFPTHGAILGFESPLDYPNDCAALTPATVHSFPVSMIIQLCGENHFAETLLRQVGVQLGMAQTHLVSPSPPLSPFFPVEFDSREMA